MAEMLCAGLSPQGYPGYSAHPGSAKFRINVPFETAITSPPICALHERPYLTNGGYELARLIERFSESGVLTAECDVTYGAEHFAMCPPHGWSGSSETTVDHACPRQRLAAWIVRRHEYGATVEPSAEVPCGAVNE